MMSDGSGTGRLPSLFNILSDSTLNRKYFTNPDKEKEFEIFRNPYVWYFLYLVSLYLSFKFESSWLFTEYF